MCTVTYIPAENNIYLTSNRDEHFTRGSALAPKKYNENNYGIIYPKDSHAGGTWVALKSGGDAAVLLNGAFAKHNRLVSYRKSRGLIFIEIVSADQPVVYFNEIDLTEIEPFTIVTFFDRQLYEFKWDGNQKYILRPDASIPHIWSSVTLYDETAVSRRKNWFTKWQHSAKKINTETIFDFHRFGGVPDPENGLIINRNGKLRTVSITSIKLSGSGSSMTYLDLTNGQKFCETLPVRSKSTSFLQRKKLLIKILNREYWPHNVIYTPIYFYWLLLSIKARSFFFFSASNPKIKNGGFLMESKKEIYDDMPAKFYPKTIFCKTEMSVNVLKKIITQNNIGFPFIAKPDIGLRGLKVELLKNEDDLISYTKKNQVDFLIQEFVNYENEVGIFYYRIPGEKKGNISGIVGKEFVIIIGDGESTIEELLWKEDRYLLQLNAIKTALGKSIHVILPEGERRVLMPIGNHSRGSKFTDLTPLVNDKLIRTIDSICKEIPEFYYGRLDIKFNDWEELYEGKNFSVIEVNGAGSEPTHIYDPRHSLFFVWKEIIHHWRLLFRISKMNAQQRKLRYMTTREGLKMFRDNAKYLKLISR
ncbi:MAG TPA: NRDE family protein [Puia sp.]|jgi:hypothetical protein|nr:NRDE family protein [Puia sp.]